MSRTINIFLAMAFHDVTAEHNANEQPTFFLAGTNINSCRYLDTFSPRSSPFTEFLKIGVGYTSLVVRQGGDL